MKYLGCAYYPEYWGPERVATDARLMRDASINIVRIKALDQFLGNKRP